MTRALVPTWGHTWRATSRRPMRPRVMPAWQAARVSGPACNPSANPPPPAHAVPIGGALTPGMRNECVRLAYDGAVPIGHTERKIVDGVPVVLWVSCHSYTVLADGSQVPGAYHGCSVYRDTAPPPPPDDSSGAAAVVILGALALGLAWAASR